MHICSFAYIHNSGQINLSDVIKNQDMFDAWVPLRDSGVCMCDVYVQNVCMHVFVCTCCDGYQLSACILLCIFARTDNTRDGFRVCVCVHVCLCILYVYR